MAVKLNKWAWLKDDKRLTDYAHKQLLSIKNILYCVA